MSTHIFSTDDYQGRPARKCNDSEILPSGKHTKNDGTLPCFMENSHFILFLWPFSIAYVSLPEGINDVAQNQPQTFHASALFSQGNWG